MTDNEIRILLRVLKLILKIIIECLERRAPKS